MRYYKFGGDAKMLGWEPCDDDGKGVAEFFAVPSDRVMKHASMIVPMVDSTPVPRTADQLPNIVTTGIWFALDTRTKCVLHLLELGKEIEFIPTTIRNTYGTSLAEYHVAFSREWHDVLDLERSDVVFYPGRRVVAEIRSWALQPNALPTTDLIYTKEYKWLATQRVKDEFDKAKITGAKFDPVWSHEDGPL